MYSRGMRDCQGFSGRQGKSTQYDGKKTAKTEFGGCECRFLKFPGKSGVHSEPFRCLNEKNVVQYLPNKL